MAAFLLYLSALILTLCECEYIKPNITNSTLMTTCYADRTDFNATCVERFHGITDGSRCYYLLQFDKGEYPDDWVASWAACKQYGSRLAQIHTNSESMKVIRYAQAAISYNLAGGSQFLIFALRDNYTIENKKCVMDSNTVYWYRDVYDPEPAMVTKNSWAYRALGCQDRDTQGAPRCFSYWYARSYTTIPESDDIGVNDYPCIGLAWGEYVALCEYSTFGQNYIKMNACLAEVPVQTIHAPNPNDCAASCSAKPWCRSFNFLDCNDGLSSICQLFPWAFGDSNRTTTGDSCCYGYTYVP